MIAAALRGRSGKVGSLSKAGHPSHQHIASKPKPKTQQACSKVLSRGVMG